MNIDYKSGTQKQNIQQDANGNLLVRQDVISYFSKSVFTGYEIYRAWSIKNPNTDEVWLYFAVKDTATNKVYVKIYTEEAALLQSYLIGNVTNPATVSLAIVFDEILINAVGADAPVYGRVGGGLVRASKTSSINPDTTTIDIPTGITCSWQGRAVIANGHNIFVSDAADVRAYVGNNFINFDSVIYSIFELDTNLIVCTGSGVFAVPSETADNQIVFGARSKISTYITTGYNQVAIHKRQLFGLTETGVVNILTGEDISISLRAANRVISTPVEALNYDMISDLYGNDSHLVVSTKLANQHHWCVIKEGLISWWTNQDRLVYLGYTREGEDLFFTSATVAKEHGNTTAVTGVVSGQVAKAPSASSVVRYITTFSNNAGFTQQVSVRNSLQTITTPSRSSSVAPIVGTSVWGATGLQYQEPEDTLVRLEFAERTQDMAIELAATEAGSTIGVMDIEVRSARTRGGLF